MKKTFFFFATLVFLSLTIYAQQYEYNTVTCIESIVPMGIGRSRMISQNQKTDYKKFTTTRSEGKDSKQGDIDRSEAKIDSFAETKLLNFYSGVGINFQNIASNDALISSKINEMTKQGWELAFVMSGVESVGGKDDDNGIFITRYIFRRKL